MLPDSDNGSRFFFLFPLYCLIDVRDAGGTQMVILRRNIPTCLPLYNQANIGQRDCPCLQVCVAALPPPNGGRGIRLPQKKFRGQTGKPVGEWLWQEHNTIIEANYR